MTKAQVIREMIEEIFVELGGKMWMSNPDFHNQVEYDDLALERGGVLVFEKTPKNGAWRRYYQFDDGSLFEIYKHIFPDNSGRYYIAYAVVKKLPKAANK